MKKILKYLYSIIPFKGRIYKYFRWINLPQSIYKHLHFKEPFTVKVAGRSVKIIHNGGMIENEIFWKQIPNGWEKKSMILWMELCKDAKIIFDIGAYHGIYSLVAKTIHPKAHIYGFEPIKSSFEIFKKNCLINKYNINCEMTAVSDQDGKAYIYGVLYGNEPGASLNKNLYKNMNSVEIDTVCLSTYINKHNITSLDLMKIDVETHESSVLEGMGEYLATYKPSILIEILTEEVGRKVHQLLYELGYSYYKIDKDSKYIKTDNLLPGNELNTNYLICEPVIAEKLFENIQKSNWNR